MAYKVILELEKVRWVDLNNVLEGLIGGGPHNFVCSLCIELCICIEQFLGWWCGTTGPKSLEDLPCHYYYRHTEVLRSPRVLNDGYGRFEELGVEFGEVASVLVHKAYQARQSSNHTA